YCFLTILSYLLALFREAGNKSKQIPNIVGVNIQENAEPTLLLILLPKPETWDQCGMRPVH
uniref:Uncharacterized protein n=1 Tax=Strigamia maritima TaxID=126957 RepID=T1JLN3_STRMM